MNYQFIKEYNLREGVRKKSSEADKEDMPIWGYVTKVSTAWN